jgi:hypothetical protein
MFDGIRILPGSSSVYLPGYEKLTGHGIMLGDKTLVITPRIDLPPETVLHLKKMTET